MVCDPSKVFLPPMICRYTTNQIWTQHESTIHNQPKQVGPQDMTHVQYIQPIIDVAGSSLSSNFQYLTET